MQPTAAQDANDTILSDLAYAGEGASAPIPEWWAGEHQDLYEMLLQVPTHILQAFNKLDAREPEQALDVMQRATDRKVTVASVDHSGFMHLDGSGQASMFAIVRVGTSEPGFRELRWPGKLGAKAAKSDPSSRLAVPLHEAQVEVHDGMLTIQLAHEHPTVGSRVVLKPVADEKDGSENLRAWEAALNAAVSVCKMPQTFCFKSVKVNSGYFDHCGVLNFISTRAGQGEWTNPVESGEVAVKWSSVDEDSMECALVSGPMAKLKFEAGSGFSGRSQTKGPTNKPRTWMRLDLGPNRRLQLQHYALRSPGQIVLRETDAKGKLKDKVVESRSQLRNWEIQGSCNAKGPWLTLGLHEGDKSLPKGKAFGVASWPIPYNFNPEFGARKHWRYFRLMQFGPNANDTTHLCCAGIELYGELRQLSAGDIADTLQREQQELDELVAKSKEYTAQRKKDEMEAQEIRARKQRRKKSGFLEKKGGLRKNWTMRFFALSPETKELVYYRTKDDWMIQGTAVFSATDQGVGASLDNAGETAELVKDQLASGAGKSGDRRCGAIDLGTISDIRLSTAPEAKSKPNEFEMETPERIWRLAASTSK